PHLLQLWHNHLAWGRWDHASLAAGAFAHRDRSDSWRAVSGSADCASDGSISPSYELNSFEGLTQASVSHGVDNIVHANPEAECRVLFGVQRVVRMFPGIAKIHVVADGHHEPAVVIVDSAPTRVEAVPFIGLARTNELRSWHLIAVVKVVNS